MSPRDWTLRIEDILESMDRIQQYTQGMSFTEFSSDRKTVEAVVYNLVIVGEAATHVPEGIVSAHPDVPWEKMRAMRNVIVHTYFGVRKQIVWETVKNDLPELVPLLKRLLPEGP